MSLVKKLGNFAMYELGDPMIRRMSHNYVQAELNLRERQYFEALKSTLKTIFHTAEEGIWLAMSYIEIRAVYAIAHGIHSSDLENIATGAGAIVLFELIKDIINNPQRYDSILSRNAGTPTGH